MIIKANIYKSIFTRKNYLFLFIDKRYRANFMVFIFLFIGLYSYSQEYWSLEKCIQYAYENNIDIKKQRLLIKSAKKELLQSKASFLPDLNGYITHSYNYGQTVDRYTNEFATDRVQSNNFNLQTNLVLFNGFQILNAYKQSKIGLEAAKYDVDKLMDDISLTIANAYLAILYAEEILAVSQSQLDVTNQQVKNTEKLVEAGTVARGTLLEIQAQQALEELNVVKAENDVILSYLNLTQLLDLESPKDFRIEKPEIAIGEDDLILMNPESIYSYAVDHQPDVKSAELRVESSEKGLDIARGASYPLLTFSGSWATGYSGISNELVNLSLSPYMYPIGITQSPNPDTVLGFTYDSEYRTKSFENQFKDNNNRTIGFYLSIPIFNNLQTRTAISQSKIEIERANHDLELTKNQLRKNIQQAYADAQAAHNSFIATKKALEASKESFKYIEQKYNVGMVNTVEYNEIKNNMTKSESDLVQAKFEYIFRTKVLDFYLGKPITLK